MYEKLKDCKKGDIVRLWCIGWNAWDNTTYKVHDQCFFTKLIDRNGNIYEFSRETECKIESF